MTPADEREAYTPTVAEELESWIAQWDYEMREHGPNPPPLADFLAERLQVAREARLTADLDKLARVLYDEFFEFEGNWSDREDFFREKATAILAVFEPREPLTAQRERVEIAIGSVLSNVMNFPQAVQARLLGQDMGPLRERIVEALFAEVFTEPRKSTAGHDHSNKPKVWCETHQHTHIASVPRFTYMCKSCGFGQWHKVDAEAHEEAQPGHETYEVEHVMRPLVSTAELQAQALEAAAAQARANFAPEPCTWVGFLDDYAARLRAGGEQS